MQPFVEVWYRPNRKTAYRHPGWVRLSLKLIDVCREILAGTAGKIRDRLTQRLLRSPAINRKSKDGLRRGVGKSSGERGFFSPLPDKVELRGR